MASSFVYPGQAFYRTLVPLKGWYRESALDAAGSLTSNVNINSTGLPAVSGMVVHAQSIVTGGMTDPYGGTTTGPANYGFEMGCKVAMGVPMSLWSSSNEPDIANPGVPAGVAAAGTASQPPDYGTVLPRLSAQNLVALVHTGAYELESTEFDDTQTYATGNGLRAVSSNTNVNAGKLTNQGATSDAFTTATLLFGDPTQTNWDTIVGFVSRGRYINANKRPALAYFSAFFPGTR